MVASPEGCALGTQRITGIIRRLQSFNLKILWACFEGIPISFKNTVENAKSVGSLAYIQNTDNDLNLRKQLEKSNFYPNLSAHN